MSPQPWLASYGAIPAHIDPDSHPSIVHLLCAAMQRYAHRPAFTCLGQTLTYAHVDQQSRAFAAYLQNVLRVRKGDRIAVMCPNLMAFPIAMLGIARAGCVQVNVNPLYTPRELEHQLLDAGARVMVIYAGSTATLAAIQDRVELHSIITVAPGDGTAADLPGPPVDAHLHTTTSFARALAEGATLPFAPPVLEGSDLLLLQYTGGTTGLSKGAMLTHRNLVANMQQAGVWVGTGLDYGNEVIITALPLYHIFALTANCLVFMKLGGLNHLITNPRDMPGFVKELKATRFTAITGVNTLFNGLLNTPGFDEVDFSNLKMTLGGGMAVQRAVAEKWKKVTGVTLVEAYGLTETSPAACINPMNLHDYNGAIGLPVPSTDACLKDDDGNIVPLGEVGELCIKGPQVMKGYWQRPEETAKVMDAEGWLHTGDMAKMDENGFFYIVDRKKDMILVSGFNVYPNEVEDVIAGLDGVLEVAAVGVPDDKSGEAVKVFIVKKDPSLTVEQIKAYCRDNLTGYKQPRYVEFRTELPKTNVGKILRKELREPAKAG